MPKSSEAKKMNWKKFLVGVGISFLIAIAVIIFILRLLSGEDNWICQNGEWVKHGNPSAQKPTTPCGSSKTESDSYNDVQDAMLASFKFID